MASTSHDESNLCKSDAQHTPFRIRNDEHSKNRRKSSMAGLAILQDEVEGPNNRRLAYKDKSLNDRFVAEPSGRKIPLNVTPRSRRLAKLLGEAGDKRLNFHSENVHPSSSSRDAAIFHAVFRGLTHSLYEIPVPLPAASASTHLSRIPETCLGAPGLRGDFYARLTDWSKDNIVAVAMNSSVACRNMQTQGISRLATLRSDEDVTCVTWSPSASLLAVGFDRGLVRIYNCGPPGLVREYRPHRERDFVGDVTWRDANVLTVGYSSGHIRQFDVREARGGKVFRSHRTRVCGVRWSSDGRYLATGGGDGVVACYDSRCDRAKPIVTVFNYDLSPPSSSDADSIASPDGEQSRRTEAELSRLSVRWRIKRHASTVKAFAWCPWEPELLASGGGTKDGAIRFWDVARNRPKHLVIPTYSQVTSLYFSQSCREIVSTHGYAFAPVVTDSVLPAPRKHSILVHNYPRGELVGKLFDPGHGRITHSCPSPDGTRILTCGSDESIRVYKIFGKQNRLPPKEESSRMQGVIR